MGIVLIALVTAACIAGSLIAANEKMGVDHGREYVFHTWWFLGLMGLLLVNLCLCSWEKSYIALTLYKKRNFKSTNRFYETAAHATGIRWNGSLDALGSHLKKRYTVSARSGNSFYSQKGLIGRTGATIIHIGLLWTMAAGFYRILADDFGWGVYDSTIILPEGERASVYFSRIDRLKGPTPSNLREKQLPFSLRALDFRAEYFPHSTVAKTFASLVEVQDGGTRQIHEVTMENPLLYRGYKITQNSFSPNEKVQRGVFRLTDATTGQVHNLDAIANDPVRITGLKQDLFLQVSDLKAGAEYHVVDLAAKSIVEQGRIADEPVKPLPIDLRPFEDTLSTSSYSMLVSALFPNFVFDESGTPTTADENFSNPAAMVMLFKQGQLHGQHWLFHHEEARRIMGQPHPDLEMIFSDFRKKPSVDGEPKTLYDYEISLALTEKPTSKSLGSIWISPGQLTELQVSDELKGTSDELKGTKGNADKRTTGSAAASSNRFQVEFLGSASGHVTFLGFMQDPSVVWLFIGCIIIITGTLVAFSFVYREVWCHYDEEAGLLYLSTAVRGTSPSAHREFDRLVSQVRLLGSPDEDGEHANARA